MKATVFVSLCTAVGILLGIGVARFQLGEATSLAIAASQDPDGGGIAPQVSIDAEIYDFGHMERYGTESHDFLFTNTGNAPLELTVGETSCKCTVGEVGSKLVEPGETVPVTLSWTANNEEAEFRQHATIHTNDPLKQTVNLTVQGRVTEASSYHPKTLLFGDVQSGKEQMASIKIVSFRDEPIEILGYEFVPPADGSQFRVEVVDLSSEEFPTSDVHSGVSVQVTAEPTLLPGPIRGWLRLKTSLPKIPEIEVPLAGKVVSDFSIVGRGYHSQRELLDLGRVVGNEGSQQELLILVHGEHGNELKLEVGEVYPDFLEAILKPGERVNESVLKIPLQIRVPKGAPPAVHIGGQDSAPGRVVIRTNHPKVEELRINVRFTVE